MKFKKEKFMVEVKKNENESSANLIRRFKNKVRQASILNKAKEIQFKKRSVSKNLKKKKALKKIEKNRQTEYLKQLGKL